MQNQGILVPNRLLKSTYAKSGDIISKPSFYTNLCKIRGHQFKTVLLNNLSKIRGDQFQNVPLNNSIQIQGTFIVPNNSFKQFYINSGEHQYIGSKKINSLNNQSLKLHQKLINLSEHTLLFRKNTFIFLFLLELYIYHIYILVKSLGFKGM